MSESAPPVPSAVIPATEGPTAPVPAQMPVEELVQLLIREIDRARDPQQAAELKVRAALLHWDGLGQKDDALRLLGGIDHPVALALRLQAAIDHVDNSALLQLADEIQRRGEGEDLAELGEILLFRGEHSRAAALLERTGETTRAIRALALSLTGRFSEAVEVLSVSSDPHALPLAAHLAEDRLGDAERARTLLRRVLDRPSAGVGPREQLRAVERLLDLEARRGGETGRIELYRRKLELLCGPKGPRGLETLLGHPHQSHVEAFGTAFLLAQALERLATPQAIVEAMQIYQMVGRYCQICPEGGALLGQHLSLRARARIEVGRGAAREAAVHYEELGRRLEALSAALPADDPLEPVLFSLALTQTRRAAELWDARVSAEEGDPADDKLREEGAQRARELYRRLCGADPADPVLVLSYVRLLLSRGGTSATKDAQEASHALYVHARAAGDSGGAELARAARAAESVHDAGAAERWLDMGNGEQRTALEALARMQRRRGDRPHLCVTYRRLAALSRGAPASSPTNRRGAAYLQVAAALSLSAIPSLPEREAEALLEEARMEEGPQGGVLTALCRVKLYGRLDRPVELASALHAASNRVFDPQTQLELLRRLGNVAQTQLSDTALAQSCYERILDIRPGDPSALQALSRLSAKQRPAQAILFLRQAIEAAQRQDPQPEGARKTAALLCELGEIYNQPGPLQDPAKAIATYEEALRHDPENATAALALLNLVQGRKDKGPAEVLDTMARAAALCVDATSKVELLLQFAHKAEDVAKSNSGAFAESCNDRALSAYLEAHTLLGSSSSPQLLDALNGIERSARAQGNYETILTVFGPRKDAHSLRLSAEAAEHLGRYAELAAAWEAEIAQLTDQAEVVQRSAALAELYEQRLSDTEAAARVWERAFTFAPDLTLERPSCQAALERLFTATERYADLARLLRRMKARLDEADEGDPQGVAKRAEERLSLLRRLATLVRDQLGDAKQAATLYEEILSLRSEDPEALQALSLLYKDQDQKEPLRKVLDLRAKLAEDPQERASVLLQQGEVAEKGGDLVQAETCYSQAFYLSPGSRAAFTALERLLYRRERWPEVLQMYEAALGLVEEQKSRAYRLGDLYTRRGQVYLQYLQRPDQALDDYKRAMDVDADNDAIQAALERIYATDNRWTELIGTYERRATLVKDDGKRVEILRRAARVAAAKLRDIPEAIRLFQKLHAVDPTDSEALDTLERHYDRSKDYEKLVGLLTTRLALSTGEVESVNLCMRIGTLCEEHLRDHNRAIAAYRQALEQQPTHREALDSLARLYEANERWAELVEVTRRQIRLCTDRAQKALLYFKSGSVTEAKFGKEDEAIRYYEMAVKTSPSCLPAVHGLRDIYLRREDWPRVTQTLELEAKLWTEEKERAGIYAHIGQIYRDKLGDLDRAIQYYESALAVDKECLPANRALFEVYYQRGDFRRAVPMAQVLSAKANREGDPQERSEFYRKRAVVAEHTKELRTAAESLVLSLEIQQENLASLELLVALCRRDSSIYDFSGLFRELEKLYRKRGPSLSKGLALTLVARSVLAERTYEVESAEELLAEAVRLSPEDFAVVEALVAQCERLRRFGPARAALLSFIEQKALVVGEGAQAALIDQVRARLRLAEMYSEAAMDSEQATKVLEELCQDFAEGTEAPRPPLDLMRVARFRLVQEYYVLGHYQEAKATLGALIDSAVMPPPGALAGSMAPPEELARYYDYLGRILETLGDGSAAQRTYRRAIDLDPGYALPVMSLARRAARGGDHRQAEELMREALAQVQGRPPEGRFDLGEELRLRRGIARLYAAYDPPQAIEAYRQTIALATAALSPDAAQAITAAPDRTGSKVVARETLDDRVALADLLLSQGEVDQAQAELHLVLQRDLRYAPAYRLLADAYERLSAPERSQRVFAALALLGYAEPGSEARPYKANLRRIPLPEELRERHLLLPAMRSPYIDLLKAVTEPLSGVFPPPWPVPGAESAPASRVADAGFKVVLAETARFYGIEADVLIARGVPGGMLAIDGVPGERPLLVFESTLIDRPESERRFLVGRGYEILRGGYALLLWLRPTALREVAKLLSQLLQGEDSREAATQDFYKNLQRKPQRLVDRLLATETKVPVDTFLSSLPLCADRGGLLSCDDISAAVRMLARLQGEELAIVDRERDRDAVLLGQAQGGSELVRYFLSDEYHSLREGVRDGTRL